MRCHHNNSRGIIIKFLALRLPNLCWELCAWDYPRQFYFIWEVRMTIFAMGLNSSVLSSHFFQ